MKEVVKKILSGKQPTLAEVNKFIVGYVESERGKVPTAEQMEGILNMLQNGLFNLSFAAKKYALTLGLNVVSLQDIATGRLIKTYVYE